jgi:hypothetical protein
VRAWLTLRISMYKKVTVGYLRNALEGLRKTTKNLCQVDRFSYGTEFSQMQTEVTATTLRCMYIAGEGPKRPQHRDHSWSIVLTTLRYLGLTSHCQLQILCTQKEKCCGSHEWGSQKDIGQTTSSLFLFIKSMPASRCDREGDMQRTSVSVYRFAPGTTK